MGNNMEKLVLISILLFLASCNDSKTHGVIDAKGDTPVKLVLCGAGESNCFVSARFKDLDGCESHKKWGEMLCDSVSNPEKMTCVKDAGAKLTYTYCTL